MENYLVLDCECSGAQRNKAHPFDPRNKLLLFGAKTRDQTTLLPIEHPSAVNLPYGLNIALIQDMVNKCDVLVGFNIKYDLHWLRIYGVTIPKDKMIWDCQLAEFILQNQQVSYPSLRDTCIKYKVPLKKDILTRYIDSGKDVSDIPIQELSEYLEGDLTSTEEVFKVQIPLLRDGGYWPLFNVQCQDLLVIEDMEFNGMHYDVNASMALGYDCLQEIQTIERDLNNIVQVTQVNWNSNDHVSAVLYGGKIKYFVAEPIGTFKTGPRAGQTKHALREKSVDLPRLVEPLKNTALKKENYWSTSADVLSELKATGKAKQIIGLLQKRSELTKLTSTYYFGIPDKFSIMNWEKDKMHGQINQCVARTGRTSSSGPNLQNIPLDGKLCFKSRFE